MAVCVSVRAPLCWVRACVSLCVFCFQPLIGRFFVCLPGIVDGVCVSVYFIVWVFVTVFGFAGVCRSACFV